MKGHWLICFSKPVFWSLVLKILILGSGSYQKLPAPLKSNVYGWQKTSTQLSKYKITCMYFSYQLYWVIFFYLIWKKIIPASCFFFFNKLVWHKIYCIWILLFISKELHLYSPFHLIAYHIVFLLGRPLKYVLITSIYTFGTFSQNRRIYIWTIVFIFIVVITMFWPSVFIRYTWITYKVFWNEPLIQSMGLDRSCSNV